MKNKNTLLAFSLGSLMACSYQNPALEIDSDTFAKAINKFEAQSISNHYAGTCGQMIATNDPDLKDPESQKECNAYLDKLAHFLNTKDKLKNIRVSDLTQADTWKHYFASHLAHGRGGSWS